MARGKIQKSISSDKVYLTALQRNEARLKAEIAKAAYALLAEKGYLRAPLEISKYDDWFIDRSLVDRLKTVFTQSVLSNAA